MDPWIEGSDFNNSWDLLTLTTKKSIESLKKFTVILNFSQKVIIRS